MELFNLVDFEYPRQQLSEGSEEAGEEDDAEARYSHLEQKLDALTQKVDELQLEQREIIALLREIAGKK